jgi:hypothetical protein
MAALLVIWQSVTVMLLPLPWLWIPPPLAWMPTVFVEPNKSGHRGAKKHGKRPYFGIGLGRNPVAV